MKQQKSDGFTLIELFLALLIVGVIATTAVPSFSGFVERQRLAGQAEAISSTLSTARAEALTRLATVSVCWNQTNAAVTVDGFSLQPGQMAVIVDRTPAEVTAGTAAVVVRDIAFSDDGLFIDDTEVDDCVSFLPSGRFDTNSTVIDPLTFGICKESGETADSKAVVLNATGRASTVDNKSGAAINCS
ncbi:MAG: type IV fimbrial biogenesis protein FimT [Arenicella sp.]|jgi:type IV fimbrial biogenesis protein FimT